MSRRDRRTLLVGAVSVATLVVLARGVPARREWQNAERTRAATLRAQLATARASVGQERATVDRFHEHASPNAIGSHSAALA